MSNKSGIERPLTDLDLSRRQLLQRMGFATVGIMAGPGLLAACSGDGGQSGSGISNLHWAQAAGPPDMNPVKRFDVQGSMVLSLGLEGLLKFNHDFKLVPNLATEFGPSKDLTKWTFKLKSGILFSDGNALTIEDVLYSYEQHLSNPKSAFGFFYNRVRDIRTQGKSDLIVELKEPYGIFGYTAAHTAGFVWQKSSGEKMGSKLGTPGNLPVGTGPYKFDTYVQNDHVSLSRNEHYRHKAGMAKNVDVRVIGDDSSRLLALRTAQIDGTYDVPPGQLSQWQSLKQAGVAKTPALGVVYLSFNTQKEPFNDVHVRRAFAYALDRGGLVKAATQGAGEVATAFVPPAFWRPLDLTRGDVLKQYSNFRHYDFNLKHAKDELEQSSHPAGFEVRAEYPSSYQRLGKMLLNLKQNLAKIGITLQVGQVTEDAWFANIYGKRAEVDLAPGYYRPDYPDPSNYAGFFSSAQIKGGNNFSSYSNPEVDKLLEEQRETQDRKERIEKLMRVLAIVQEQAVVATAWWESSLLATQDSITSYPDPIWYLDPWALTIKTKTGDKK